MNIAATAIGLLVCLFIIVIGLRFLLSPSGAATGFGIQPDNSRALTAIKGVRDIASGLIVFAVWVTSTPAAFGWALLAAALIPIGDAVIVSTAGHRPGYALGVHGVTALLMIAAGAVLLAA
jgi:hypothetical protein